MENFSNMVLLQGGKYHGIAVKGDLFINNELTLIDNEGVGHLYDNKVYNDTSKRIALVTSEDYAIFIKTI